VLEAHGYRAPTHLGIDDRITGSTRVVEDELVEAELFREFLDGFQDDHPEYADFFRALSDRSDLLDVVTEFASKGVFPRLRAGTATASRSSTEISRRSKPCSTR